MRKLILILMMFNVLPVFGEAWTEFYIDNATGDNLNSGHTSAATATYTSTSGNWTNTSATVGTFYKSGITPGAGGVTNGAWASVYVTDQTATGFIGRVIGFGDDTNCILVSLVAKAGTPPTDIVGTANIRVGGAWKGFGKWEAVAGSTTNTFPTALVANTMTNTSQNPPCINIKGGTQYDVTNAMTISGNGPLMWCGYTNAPRDGGKAVIDGGVVNLYYAVITYSASDTVFSDVIVANNGGTGGAADMFSVTGSENTFQRCVFHDSRRAALRNNSSDNVFLECEQYNGNKSGSASYGGVYQGSTAVFIRCFIHDNSGSVNAHGLWGAGAGASLINCIFDSNAGCGVSISGATALYLLGCEFYNNAVSGVDMTSTSSTLLFAQNCNFIKNGVYGLDSSGSYLRSGIIANCGFGSGTMTNVSGSLGPNISDPRSGVVQNGNITYTADAIPWADAPNGDFRITLTAAKAAGRGAFTETAASYAGTIAYPDIGAAQTASTNAAAGEHSHVFAQ